MAHTKPRCGDGYLDVGGLILLPNKAANNNNNNNNNINNNNNNKGCLTWQLSRVA